MAYAPGVDLGTLKLLPEASRPSAWQVNGSTTRDAWTDAWGSGTPNPYTPKGVKALRLKFAVVFTGDGAYDYAGVSLRKNGSSITDTDQLHRLVCYQTNAPTGTTPSMYGEVDCLCDEDGIIEYYIQSASGARADGTLYLSTIGYWM